MNRLEWRKSSRNLRKLLRKVPEGEALQKYKFAIRSFTRRGKTRILLYNGVSDLVLASFELVHGNIWVVRYRKNSRYVNEILKFKPRGFGVRFVASRGLFQGKRFMSSHYRDNIRNQVRSNNIQFRCPGGFIDTRGSFIELREDNRVTVSPVYHQNGQPLDPGELEAAVELLEEIHGLEMATGRVVLHNERGFAIEQLLEIKNQLEREEDFQQRLQRQYARQIENLRMTQGSVFPVRDASQEQWIRGQQLFRGRLNDVQMSSPFGTTSADEPTPLAVPRNAFEELTQHLEQEFGQARLRNR